MNGVDTPVFVINLDRRPERFEAVFENLDRLGLKAVRVSATDAKTVTDKELRTRVALKLQMRKMGRGVEANLLSHIRTLELFLTTSSPSALVLEDDMELAKDLPLFLRSLDWWPKHASLVKLEAQSRKSRVFGSECAPRHEGRQLRPISLSSAGCGGYMITRDAANLILTECRQATMPFDCVLYDLRYSRIARKLRPIQVLPGLVRQRVNDFESDIRGLRKDARPAGLSRPWRRLEYHAMALQRKTVVSAQRLVGRADKVLLDFADTVPSQR